MLARARKSLRGSAQGLALPAPTGGLNTSSPAMNMPPTDCMVLYNMLAAESGLRARLGSREWVTGLTGATDDLVRTVIPYTGSATTATRLFATTSDGIWDVTASTPAPGGSPTFAFSSSAGNAGYGVAHAFTTLAGNFLLYCDEVNGYHVYSEATGLWAAVAMGGGASQVSGVDPTTFVYVTVFKGFACFAKRDSTDIWILPIGSVYGAASRLGVGYKLQAGGSIVGLYSWTYDGGAGLDDSLVAVSKGGDVVVFQGTDPTASDSFGISGVWGVGKVPAGRNLATPFGGDLLLLTRGGILPMSRLVVGKPLDADTYETRKISNLFNQLMLSYGDTLGWSLNLHPEESALIVTVPTGAGLPTTQLAMSLADRSWSQLRDLDIYSCAPYEGKLYYGTSDGRVGINDGNVDGVTLADPTAYAAIQYSGVGAFQNYGTGAKKQVHIIKPYFMSRSAAPSFSVGARYDFNLNELDAVSLSAASGGTWDSGLWDDMVWGGDYAASTGVRGASGLGSNIAIAWRGASVDRTVLTGFEISFSTGGML